MLRKFLTGFLIAVLISGCISQTSDGEALKCNDNVDLVCGTDGRTYVNSCHAENENATVAEPGVCNALGCNDSDLGFNIDTVGTVVAMGEEKTDSCANSSTLIEYECRYGRIYDLFVHCPSGSCENGECVSCIDSDGAEIFTYGEVRNFDSPYNSNTFRDECRQIGWNVTCTEFYKDDLSPTGYSWRTTECSNEVLLEEYRCLNDRPYSSFIKCPAGFQCFAGKCAPMDSS